MNNLITPGLGELLRHMVELTDGSADSWYSEQNFNYRPRYTPIMRALMNGPASVSDINKQLSITQGAVSQTVKLMLEEGLIKKQKGKDARQSIIYLTNSGQNLLRELQPHWDATLNAVEELESEIDLPLLKSLKRAVRALERNSYAVRVSKIKNKTLVKKPKTISDNYFHEGSGLYAEYRPEYPAELAVSLSHLVKENTIALDVGCGNGQLTALLAPYFDHVVGTDLSQNQLECAKKCGNVTYLQEPSENISLSSNSVDLITAAQAAHWFDLDRFYSEVRRIAKKDAIIALISYGVPYISDYSNAIFQKGYWQDIHKFWPAQRTHVETGYADLYFPFHQIKSPKHHCRMAMDVEHFIGYITTWSAYIRAKKNGEIQQFEMFFNVLRENWQNEIKEVFWPISMRIGRVT